MRKLFYLIAISVSIAFLELSWNVAYAQKGKGVPLPEFYGIYAVDRDRLYEMIAEKSGKAFEFSPNVNFIIYGVEYLPFGKVKVELVKAVFIRNKIIVNQKDSGEGADAITQYAKWAPLKTNIDEYKGEFIVDLLTKPIKDKQDMRQVVPRERLNPGVYNLYVLNKFVGWFWVGKYEELLKKYCFDIYEAPKPVVGFNRDYNYFDSRDAKPCSILDQLGEESSQGEIDSPGAELQKLRTFITDQWKQVAQIPQPKRDWRELVTLKITGKYDDYSTLYLMGLNRRSLSNDALVLADKFLSKGDLENTKKYADLATRHYIESNELFKASEQVFIGSVEMTAQTLEAMYRGPKEASKYGWFLMCGPKCYEVADYVFLMTDFAMDYGIEGMDEAKKNLIVNAFVKTLLKTSGVSKWIENRTTHLIGDSGLYGLMDKTLNSPEFQKAFMKVVAESGAYTTQKMANEGGKK